MKKNKVARDPNSMVPFIFSALIILAVGFGLAYVLNEGIQTGQGNDAAALVLGFSIVTSGILFIAAWAKRK